MSKVTPSQALARSEPTVEGPVEATVSSTFQASKKGDTKFYFTAETHVVATNAIGLIFRQQLIFRASSNALVILGVEISTCLQTSPTPTPSIIFDQTYENEFGSVHFKRKLNSFSRIFLLKQWERIIVKNERRGLLTLTILNPHPVPSISLPPPQKTQNEMGKWISVPIRRFFLLLICLHFP